MENKNELNRKYQYGWYGTCESECNTLYFDGLQDRDYIESVIRVAPADGKSFEKFTAYDSSTLAWAQNLPEGETFDDYINPQFKYMDCGMGYLVVRNSELDKNPEISGFTVAEHNGDSGGFIAIDGCPDPTPTPTPVAPFIQINTVSYNHHHDNQDHADKVEVTFTIQLTDATSWQYEISEDDNNYVIPADSSGNPVKTAKFYREPGTYTLTVTAFDSTGSIATGNERSTDSRVVVVEALTPTPTPEKTPTPTPTIHHVPTPTPTPTPINCECIPSTHTTVAIQQAPQTFDRGTLAFSVGDELGLNLDQLVNEGTSCSITVNDPDGDQLGLIVLTGFQPASSGMEIYLKTTSDICYEGVANDENGGGDSWEVTMTMRDLPEGCQPTPTPEAEDCCAGKQESTPVAETIAPRNHVAGQAMDVTGKLCWNTLGDPAGQVINLQFNCPLVDNSWGHGGFTITVQGVMDDSNNVFRFEHTDGKCYQGTLTDSAGGSNIFTRIS